MLIGSNGKIVEKWLGNYSVAILLERVGEEYLGSRVRSPQYHDDRTYRMFSQLYYSIFPENKCIILM